MSATELRDLLKEAKQALEMLDKGKLLSSSYVVSRFEDAQQKHPTDQLIGHMRDVIKKRANVQYGFSQSEIGNLYNEMLGLGGGKSEFRSTLGDLLPESLQEVASPVKTESNLRMDSNTVVSDNLTDQNLVNAFSKIFGFDKKSKVTKLADDSKVKKSVRLQLQSINMTPQEVVVGENNEHFVLATAIYVMPSFKKIAVQIPVEISNSLPKFPESFIDNGEIVDLTEVNLLTHLRQKEADATYNSRYKYSSDSGQLVDVKAEVPELLKADIDDLEARLLASSHFSQKEVFASINLVNDELKRIGAVNPNVKLNNADQYGMLLTATLNTPHGKVAINIPIEVHNGTPILPSSFSPVNESVSYDFEVTDFNKFLSSLESSSPAISFARDNGNLKDLGYHQLIDTMIDGVTNNDYGASEDALLVIQSKFDQSKYMEALNKYAVLLKVVSQKGQETDLVKSAIRSGDLIKVSTSTEWYNPKLMLPLSKIEFDQNGDMYPKGRLSKSANLQAEVEALGLNKIKFS